jgi:hypothetical protein
MDDDPRWFAAVRSFWSKRLIDQPDELEPEAHAELIQMHRALIDDRQPVSCNILQHVHASGPPHIRLTFTGHLVVVDALFCEFFRAQFQSVRNIIWTTRPIYYCTNTSEVELRPLPDQLEIQAATRWADLMDDDPISRASIGLLGFHPQRMIDFRGNFH